MYYHVRLEKQPGYETRFDLSREELELRVLEPYRNLRPIVINGTTIPIADLVRIQVIESDRGSSTFNEWTKNHAQAGVTDWFSMEPGLKDVSDEFITTPSMGALPQRTDAIELICSRFHVISTQLRDRWSSRPTLDVTDEYDVQDLMHSLLRVFNDDVRKEQWTPSYAGKSARMDFLLPVDKVVVECKKTRQGLNAAQIGDELLVDIARYKVHPDCKRLVCFVYDPEGRVVNPGGIERDLSRKAGELEVKVIITPKGF